MNERKLVAVDPYMEMFSDIADGLGDLTARVEDIEDAHPGTYVAVTDFDYDFENLLGYYDKTHIYDDEMGLMGVEDIAEDGAVIDYAGGPLDQIGDVHLAIDKEVHQQGLQMSYNVIPEASFDYGTIHPDTVEPFEEDGFVRMDRISGGDEEMDRRMGLAGLIDVNTVSMDYFI